MSFEFVELEPFCKIRDELFSEEEYLAFQWRLIQYPEAGEVIPETGGCRKIRWKTGERGKRGGIRVIYFLRNALGQIVIVYAYAKNSQADASRRFLRELEGRCDD